MKTTNIKRNKRTRRHAKIRVRVSGTATTPRLAVFKSNKYLYAQLINDDKAITIGSAKGAKTLKAAATIGKTIAEKAIALKVKAVVFDRGGFAYKGRIKALADGAREGGLKF